MVDWRFLRGWTEAELRSALERAGSLPLNFSLSEEMSPRRGWNRTDSHALIARESSGPPVGDGPLDRVWRAIQEFEHSDPRIVVAHFFEGEALLRQRMLLELRSLGFRFLCPVEIGDTLHVSRPDETLRGFAIDTLQGHIERGREWFLLEKDHSSGEVRFRIEAVWQPGEFPTTWARWGFHLLGRRYQRAWHRLAHTRLRRIAAGLEEVPSTIAGRMVHEGRPMPVEPIRFYARRGVGRWGVDVEQEHEDIRSDRLWRALGMGALSGLRSMGSPAVLARGLESRGKDLFSGRKLPRLGRKLMTIAAGEMVADKLPFMPSRVLLPSLAARMASGAFVGSTVARKKESKLEPALLGSIAAAASSFAGHRIRELAARRSRILGLAVALAEDALVLWAGTRLARQTSRATAG